jgi:copper transport protein
MSQTTMAKRLLLVLGTLLALVVAGVAGAGSASAHAALIKADPKDGSVVKTAPAQVRLGFSEGVLLSADSIKVLGPDGRRADTGGVNHVGGDSSTAMTALHSGLPDGTYVVAWKAVSADSHPVAGAFTFSIGAPSKTTVSLPQQEAGGGVAGVLYGIGRYVSYAGYALLVGTCVFLTVCWPRGARLRPMRRLAVSGWTALVAGTIALLMLRGPYANGGGLGQAFDLGVIREELAAKPGAALVSRLLLLAAAAVFLSVLFGSYAREDADPRERQDLAWGLGIGGTVVTAGLAASWAMAEHASVGIQAGIAMPVDIVHLIAMAVWLGGLVTLLTALTRGIAVERDAVLRFSKIAFAAVATLAATGLYQSWRQVGSWNALVSTGYGQLLLVKVGLVAVLVELAWFSRRWTGRLMERSAVATTAATASMARKSGKSVKSGKSGKGEAGAEAEGKSEAKAKGKSKVHAAAGSAPGTTTRTPPEQETGDVGPAGPSPSTADPVRAAQLQRQKAAAAKAKARRERDADPERTGLRRSVLAEVAVAVAVLAVTTLLTGTQPGRADEEQRAAAAAANVTSPSPGATAATGKARTVDVSIPFDTGGTNGKGDAELTLSPARTGSRNELHLLITGTDGAPRDVPEVRISFTLKAKKIGPIPVTLEKIDTGHWTSADVTLPISGTWTAAVSVRTSDIDEITETKNVEITP